MDTHELMHKIDEILYGEHTQPYSTGDQLSMLVANCIQEAYKKGYIDGKLEGFDVAFDCHDYDRLRTYRAELAQLRSTHNE